MVATACRTCATCARAARVDYGKAHQDEYELELVEQS